MSSSSSSWGFQVPGAEDGVTPRQIPSLARGENKEILTLCLQPAGLFGRSNETIPCKRICIVGDVEPCSANILCRFMMETAGTWAFQSCSKPREVCYYNGNRELNLKMIEKTLGLQLQLQLNDGTSEGGNSEDQQHFLRHALLASTVNFLLNSGMQRVEIEHESDLCFSRVRPRPAVQETSCEEMEEGKPFEDTDLLDVICLDNLVFCYSEPPCAHLNVSAFVYRRRPWVAPPDPSDPATASASAESTTDYNLSTSADPMAMVANIACSGLSGTIFVKKLFHIPESIDDKDSAQHLLFSTADLANRKRGYLLYLPDTVSRMLHYWDLRAGIRLSNPRNLAKVAEAKDDDFSAERTEILPVEVLVKNPLQHCPSKTRTDGAAIVEAVAQLLRQAKFIISVEVMGAVNNDSSSSSSSNSNSSSDKAEPKTKRLVFQSAAQLLKAKREKEPLGNVKKQQKREHSTDDREYTSSNALAFSDSDNFSDSDDDCDDDLFK